jgi:hypothetical protein
MYVKMPTVNTKLKMPKVFENVSDDICINKEYNIIPKTDSCILIIVSNVKK